LCKAQLKELRGVFNRFATSRHDSEPKALSEVELVWALRWLGIVLPLPRIQQLLSDSDGNSSGRIEWEEFLKLARQLYDAEMEAVSSAFAAAGNPKTLSVHHGCLLRDVLLALGYSPRPELLEPLIMRHEKNATFQDFLYLVGDFRKVSQRALRQKEGFTPPEVEALQAQFEVFDKDGDGVVGGHELRHLIEFVEPAAGSDAKARDRVASILAEIDTKDEKIITFQQFLKLMRKLQVAHEAEMQEKEETLAKSTGFERADVRDFHSVFTTHADLEDEITVNGIRHMLSHLVPMKNDCKLHIELKKFFREADVDRSGALDFPEFLVLLRLLEDTNFGNINEVSDRVAASLRKPIEVHSGTKTDLPSKRLRKAAKRLPCLSWLSKATAKKILQRNLHSSDVAFTH